MIQLSSQHLRARYSHAPMRLTQPGFRHVSAIRKVIPQDSVRFGNHLAKQEDIAPPIVIVKESQLSPDFLNNATEGIQRAWESFPPALRKALVEAGCHYKIAPSSEDMLINAEEVLSLLKTMLIATNPIKT